jgi:hypothetical protein
MLVEVGAVLFFPALGIPVSALVKTSSGTATSWLLLLLNCLIPLVPIALYANIRTDTVPSDRELLPMNSESRLISFLSVWTLPAVVFLIAIWFLKAVYVP